MPRITRDEVEHVASLARLSLSDEEARRASEELDRVLGYVELLREVDTRDVQPTAHAIPLETPLRPDRAEPPLDPRLALAGAPESVDSAFVVPKVIESEDEG